MGFFDELAQKVMKGKEAQKSNYCNKRRCPTLIYATETVAQT